MVAIIAGNGLGLERSSAWVLGSQGQLGAAAQGRGADNVYVNAITGNLVIRNTDEMLMGVGLNDAISRTHNSLGAADGDNNDGWRESVMRTVAGLTGAINTAGSTITRTDWDGSKVVYAWNASRGAYVSTDGQGAYDTLTFSGATWTWTDGATRVRESYDDAHGGRITGQTDLDGNQITYGYTGDKLTRVATQAAAGGVAEYTDIVWGTGAASSNILRIETSRHTAGPTDALTKLTRVHYGYDASNRLTSVTVDLSPDDNSYADGKVYVTTYAYDGDSKRVASITQSDGSRLDIAYVQLSPDGDMRVSKLTQYAVGETGKRETLLSYNTVTRATTITDPLGLSTALTYDAAGQLVRITSPQLGAGPGLVTQFEYSADGDVTKVIAPTGATVTYGYDANGNRTSETDTLGNQISRTFGANNELLTETRYLDGGATVPVTTRYAYDARNHLRYAVSAEGYVTEYVYNALGQQTSVIQYAASVYGLSGLAPAQTISEAVLTAWVANTADKINLKRTDTAYDFRGQIATVTRFSKVKADGSRAGDTTAEMSVTTYVYDQAGQLVSRKPSTSSRAETFVYDGLGRVIATTDFANNSVSTVFNDALGKTIVTNNATGLVRTSTYNRAGELISYGESGGAGVTTYTYDADGLMRLVTDPLGKTRQLIYDEAGRQVFDIASDGTVTEYGYTPDGLIARTIRYATQLPRYQLDYLAMIAPTAMAAAGGRPPAQAADRWEWRIYDDAHRLIETIDSTGAATVYQYDGAGRQTASIAYATRFSASVIQGFKTTPPITLQTPASASGNVAPIVVADPTYTTDWATTIQLRPLDNDTDADGDVLAIVRTDPVANGSVSRTGNVITYKPRRGWTGTETITYYVTDGKGHEVAGTVRVEVLSANISPAASDLTASSMGGAMVVLQPLTTASDPDGDSLALTGVGAASHGTVSFGSGLIFYKPTAGYDGVDSFTYTITDAYGGTAVGTVSVTVDSNRAPTGMLSFSAASRGGNPTTVWPLNNIFDPEGDAVTIASIGTAAHGTVSRNGDAITYTPTAGYIGPDSFTYTVSDGKGGIAIGTISLTVVANLAPVAGDHAVSTMGEEPARLLLLSQASDDDGDPLTVTAIGAPSHGVVSQDGPIVTYTPTAGYDGVDSFTYTVSDGKGGTATGTVYVTVSSNHAPVTQFHTLITMVGTPATIKPLSTDSDPDGDTLTITSVGTPSHGTASLNGDTITYTPAAGYSGVDFVSYTVSDGKGGVRSGSVYVTVWANTAPVAVDLAASSMGGAGVAIWPLPSASDADGDALWLSAVATPAHGTVSFSSAAIIYTPTGGYDGIDSFTYTVTDAKGGFATATINVTVSTNHAPVLAYNQTGQSRGGAPVTLWPLYGFSDPDGDVLTVTAVGTPAHGTVSFSGSTITYTPTAGYIGSDSFTYTISDGRGGATTGTVAMTVIANLAPVAGDHALNAAGGAPVTFWPLSRASDLDGDGLTVTAIGTPSHGVVSRNGDMVTYTPAAGYDGEDSFTYTVSDGKGGTATGTVRVTVVSNRAPVANVYGRITMVGTPLEVRPLDYASDPDGDPLTIIAVETPSHGTVSLNGDTITYTPAQGYAGEDSFTYTVSDGRGGTAIAAIYVTVKANHDPVEVFGLSAGTMSGRPVTLWPLFNVSDPDGDTLTISAVGTPAHGTVSVSGGAITYTPAAGYYGEDSFTYTVSDGKGGTVTGTARVTVSNWAPVAHNYWPVTMVGIPVTVQPLATATDPDGDPLTIAAIGTPLHGVASLSGSVITYTPALGYSGEDSFTYTVSDGKGGMTTATIHVVVQSNRTPQVIGDTVTTQVGTPVTLRPLDNDYDQDGDNLTIVGVSTPLHGTVVLDGDTITYTPEAGYVGPDSFNYTVSDGTGGVGYAPVTITVNSAPVARDDTFTVRFEKATPLSPVANDSDSDGDLLTIVATGTPSHGAVWFGSDTIYYTPATGYSGPDSFTYTVSDRKGGLSTATITITVLPNRAPVATDDSFTIYEMSETPLAILANDSDADGDPLWISNISVSPYGELTLVSGTNVVYHPYGRAPATDSFTYTLTDRYGATSTATINLTINRRPVANLGEITVVSGETIDFPPDAYDAEGDAFQLVGATASTSHGTVSVVGPLTLRYASTPGYVGWDFIQYTIAEDPLNPGRGSTTGTMSIRVVAPNQAPVVANDTVVVDFETPKTLPLLANDSDPDGDPLTIVSTSTPTHGTIVLAGGQVTYTPAAGYLGPDSFTYTVSDGRGGVRTATVNLDVKLDQAPVAANDTVTVGFETPATLSLLANDSDPDGDPLTIVSTSTPAHGTAVIVGGQVTYTPAAGYLGPDSFTYTVSDGRGGVRTATVNVTVRPNHAPVAVDDSFEIFELAGTPLAVLANDTDADGDTLTITSATSAAGVVTILNGTNLVFRPFRGRAPATASISYTVSDGYGGTSTATVNLTINRRPVVPITEITVVSGETIDFQTNAYDEEGDALQLSGLPTPGGPQTVSTGHGMVSIVGPLTLRYVSTPGYVGEDVINYAITEDPQNPNRGSVLGGVKIHVVAASQAQAAGPSARSFAVQAQSASQGFAATQATASLPAVGPEDRVTRNFYDNDGRLVGVLDAEGYLTQTQYDAAGQRVRTTRYATATAANLRADGAFSALRASVGATGADINDWYLYDGRGFLAATVDGEGDVTRYGYNGAGDVTRKTTGLKADVSGWTSTPPTLASLPTTPLAGQAMDVVDYQYDAFGKVTQETRALTGGGAEITNYAYDADHQLISRTEAANTTSARGARQFFDARGRLTGVLSGEGAAMLPASPTQAQIDDVLARHGVRYVYDDANRLVAMIEGNGRDTAGQKTVYYYDVNNRLTYEVNAVGEVTQYGYDVFGGRSDVVQYYNRIASLSGLTGGDVTSALTSAISADYARDARTHVDYDSRGQVKSTTKAVTAAVSATTTYAYNAFGELISQLDPLTETVTTTTTRSYDRRGLLTSTTVDASALGLITRQTYDAFGRVVQTRDAAGRVTVTNYDRAGRTITTTDPTGVSRGFTYDARGSVLTSTDATGATTRYAYTAFNRTMTVTTPEGLVTTTQYSPQGQQISFSDGAGRTTSWSYDRNGKLAGVVDNAGVAAEANAYDALGRLLTSTNALGTVTTYAYDAANRVVTRVVDPSGLNLRTTYRYDGEGRQVLVTEGEGSSAAVATTYGYDRTGQRVSVSVGDLSKISYAYDLAGRTTTVTEGTEWISLRVTQYVYDGADRLIQTRVDPTGKNLVTRYAYDEVGNVVAKTDAVGEKTRYVYDGDNRQIYAVDPAGDVTFTRYDGEGRVIGRTTYAARITDLANLADALTPSSITSRIAADAGRDETTSYVYDRDGRLRYVIDAGGRPTEYAYDGSGNVVHVTTYGGVIAASASYTTASVQQEIASRGLAADPATRTTRSVYDAAGRMAYSIDALGSVTALDRDAAGNVTYTVRYEARLTSGGTPSLNSDPTIAAMNAWRFTPGAQPNTYASQPYSYTKTIYDAAGRATFAFDAKGFVSERQYDALGHVTAELRYDQAYGATGQTTIAQMRALAASWQTNAARTSYVYDSAGRLTDVIRKIDTSGATARTHFELNALGWVVRETAAYGAPEASVTYNTYDGAGRLVSRTLGYGAPEASTTSYGYDGNGNVVWSLDGDGYLTTQTWQAGRLTSVTQAGGTTGYGYDAFGNRVTVRDPRGGVGYFYYDKLNRVTLQVDPEGYATGTTYGVTDQPLTVTRYKNRASGVGSPGVTPTVQASTDDATTRFTRDRLDRVTDVTDAMGFTESYAYDFAGRVKEVRNRLGGITRREYDIVDRLISETVVIDGASVNPTTTYGYDARGNRRTVTEGAGSSVSRTTTYGYDLLDRVISTVGDSVSVTTLTLQNGPNQIASPTVRQAAPTIQTRYDKRGNVIETVDASGARTVRYYDALNRKVAEITPTGAVGGSQGALTTWAYDGNGNVMRTRAYATLVWTDGAAGAAPIPGGDYRETTFTYDQANRLQTTKIANIRVGWLSGGGYASGIVDILTVSGYDAAGNLVRQVDGRGSVRYAYYDKLGRKVGEVDAGGYLTTYVLDAEGNVTRERRFANRLTTGYDASSDITALAASVQASADDRITDFTYDKNGRRTSETRLSVVAVSINVTTGAVDSAVVSGPTAVSSIIRYEYNALGEVTAKVEATGDRFEYRYDSAGRQTWAIGAYDAAMGVQSHTQYRYNALGDVEQILAGGTYLGDRVTRYVYGAGGRLVSMTDASGFTRNYEYDLSGRLVKETYSRARADGGSEQNAILYVYDLAGRLVQQTTAAQANATTWVTSDVSQLRYDAYGQVTGKGVNGLFQETFEYDAAGRVWRSSAGDGVARVYLYDQAGNKTLTIESNGGLDLASGSLEQILWNLGGVGNLTSQSSVFTTTAYGYDARNEAVQTVEFWRQVVNPNLRNTVLAQTLNSYKTYNAFGEVTSITDQRGGQTSYQYNTLGKVIRKINPTVTSDADRAYVLGANGQVLDATGFYIIETYRYDASGRLIQSFDDHGVETRRQLMAGSGYGDDAALTLREFHADGGVVTYTTNALGEVTEIKNEVGAKEQRGYDALGRLNFVQRAGGEVETYAYDGLGQRIRRYSSTRGAEQRTAYDVQGRVTRETSFAGEVTDYTYVWNAADGSDGLGVFGAWTKFTLLPYYMPNTGSRVQSAERTDYFGRVIARSDNGPTNSPPVYSLSTFDKAGRLVRRTSVYTNGSSQGSNFTYAYFNTGLVASITDTSLIERSSNPAAGYVAATGTTSFIYDGSGNRVYETYLVYKEGVTRVMQTTAGYYDAAGRLTAVLQGDGVDGKTFLTQYFYTANGDIRRIKTTHDQVATVDNPTPGRVSEDYWYDYDALGRMTLSQGQLVNGYVARGATGTSIEYDAAGRRTSVIVSTAIYSGSTTLRDHKENYAYNLDGYLVASSAADSGYYTLGSTPPALFGADFHTMSVVNRDALGRATSNYEYNAAGANVFEHHYSYNADSQIIYDDGYSTQADSARIHASVTYSYVNGLLTQTNTVNRQVTGNGEQALAGSTTTYGYTYRDKALQETIRTTAQGGGVSTSTFAYDANNNIRQVVISDTRPRTIDYTTDAMGRVLKRTENGGGAANPVEYYFYFDGMRIGDIGNNGSSQASYAETINDRTRAVQTGAFRSGQGQPYANFDQSYSPINAQSAMVSGSGAAYAVRAGDSLWSIAKALWGDESLWYVLADANGLTGASALPPGATLIIPSNVISAHNTSDTFKVYDPNEALGDVQPIPRPGQLAQASPKKGGCGGVGQIILAVVAIAVTAIAAPLAVGALTGGQVAFGTAFAQFAGASVAAGATTAGAGTLIAGAAVGAAVGSAVSQGIGVATGLQDQFSWNAVALAAVSAGVTQGVNLNPALARAGNGNAFINGAVRQGVSNAVNQGIGVAAGLQNRFDWGGVAVAAVIGGVDKAVGDSAAFKDFAGPDPNFLVRSIPGAAGSIAGAATRSLVTGTDFGDNLRAALPGIVEATVGNAITDYVRGRILAAGSKPLLRLAIDQAKSAAFKGQDVPGIASVLEGQAAALTDDPIGALIAYSSNAELSNGFLASAAAYATLRDADISDNADPGDILKLRYSGPAIGQQSNGYDQQRGPNDIVVVGRNQTFGALVAGSAVSFGNWLGDGDNARNVGLVTTGLAILKGGPVGFALDYASGQAVDFTLRATGLDKNVAEFTSYVNGAGLSLLDHGDFHSVSNYSGLDASRLNVADGRAFGQASSVVLGAVVLGGGLVGGKTWAGGKLAAAEGSAPHMPQPGDLDFVGPLELSTRASQITAPINFDGHILAGELKPNGSVVGGHSTASGNVRAMPGTASQPNAQGVYKSKIEVRDPMNPGQWVTKTNNNGVSTMFPDSWSADRIKVEVDFAYQNRIVSGNRWTGTTPSGVSVTGWVAPKTTVYPIY